MTFLPRLNGLARIAALAGLVMLTGCFDIEQKVTLRADGGGNMSVRLITDEVMSEDTTVDALLRSSDGKSEVREYSEDGRFVHEETLSFDTLDTLLLSDEAMSVRLRDRLFWGAGPSRLTFERRLDPLGSRDDFGLLQRFLADRTYTFELTLPGWIESVAPIRIEDVEIVPAREGNTLTWTIPLGLLMQAESLVFAVDFTTFGDLAPGASKAAPQDRFSALLGRIVERRASE